MATWGFPQVPPKSIYDTCLESHALVLGPADDLSHQVG
jgi:hypothetical protein